MKNPAEYIAFALADYTWSEREADRRAKMILKNFKSAEVRITGYEIKDVWLKKISKDKLDEMILSGMEVNTNKAYHLILFLETDDKNISIGLSIANRTISYSYNNVVRFYKLPVSASSHTFNEAVATFVERLLNL